MKKKRHSKRLSSLLLVGLLSIFFISANAGPPPGGRVLQVPFYMYCHPSAAAMIKAVMESFGQHIAITFRPHEKLNIYIMWNKTEGTVSIVGERDTDTCLIISGGGAEWFERPPMMPPRTRKLEDIEA